MSGDPWEKILVGMYLTDEQRLAYVLRADKNRIVLQDAMTEREFEIKPIELAAWREVEPAA